MRDSLQRKPRRRIGGRIWQPDARVAAATLVALAVVLAGMLAMSGVAEAQYRRSGGNFFEQLFGGGLFQPPPRQPQMLPREPSAQPQSADYSRAPAPRKPGKDDPEPTTTVMVFGDSMADWLAFGLENTFSDTPEVAVVRKHRLHSGLIRYESRGDLDWPHVARDVLAKEKANFIVVMLGLNDRTAIREPPRKKEADAAKERPARKDAKDSKDSKTDGKPDSKPGETQDAAAKTDNAAPEHADDEADAPASLVVPETVAAPAPGSSNEFRSDRWAELYSRKIDEMIAAVKAEGVPVIWVGLPSIRGTRSTSDALYLNDLFRSRAQKAGIIYVDVWDGFVDENNRYSLHGPDVEGQTRRLRAYDGVHFTSYGARKLAHYVDREIRRLMSGRATPIALPSDASGVEVETPTGRPLAGPVVPLTGTAASGSELLGGGRNTGISDAVAARVLVRGEPLTAPTGRADNFVWPRSDADLAPGAVLPPETPALPAAAPPVALAPAAEPAKKPATRASSPPPERRTVSGNAPSHPQGGIARPPANIPQQQQQQRPAPRPMPRLEDGFFGLFR